MERGDGNVGGRGVYTDSTSTQSSKTLSRVYEAWSKTVAIYSPQTLIPLHIQRLTRPTH